MTPPAVAAHDPSDVPAGTKLPDPVLLVIRRRTEMWRLRFLLGALGYPVVTGPGSPAVHIVERQHSSFHLVVTDLFAPAGDGLTFAEAIAPYRSVIPVLLIVERPDDLAAFALDQAMVAAVAQPVTGSTLAQGIMAAREVQDTLRDRVKLAGSEDRRHRLTA